MSTPSLMLLLGQCYAERVGIPHIYGQADLLSELTDNPLLLADARDYRKSINGITPERDFVSNVHREVLDAVLAQIPDPPPS